MTPRVVLAVLGFAALPALAQTTTVQPTPSNRLDPASTHLRRDCFDANTKTYKATRECDAARLGAPVASSPNAPSVGTSSSLSSTTTTGTNALAPSANLTGSPPAMTAAPPPPVIGSANSTAGTTNATGTTPGSSGTH